MRKPSGSEVMVSPWLIHTVSPGSMPARSASELSTDVSMARPYSREGALSTVPPAWYAIIWAP